jgi:hypothetical protein
MGKGLNAYTASEGINVQLGQAGWDVVTNATVNADTYIAITMLVGSEVIADNSASGTVAATSVDTDLGDNLSALEIPEGCTIYGRWSAVTIGSGDTAIVYRG